MWAYLHTLGSFWGVTIPAAIFTNRFDRNINLITDLALRQRLAHGQAYESASKQLVDSINSPTSVDQVVTFYTQSLQWTWYIGVIFAGVALVLTCVQKEYPLKTVAEKEVADNEQEVTEKGLQTAEVKAVTEEK